MAGAPSRTRWRATTLSAISRTRHASSSSADKTAGAATSSQFQSRPRAAHTLSGSQARSVSRSSPTEPGGLPVPRSGQGPHRARRAGRRTRRRRRACPGGALLPMLSLGVHFDARTPRSLRPGAAVRLDVAGEVGQRGREPGRVVLRGDAGGDVLGADVHARPSSVAVTSQVIVMVPARSGSSATKVTACTTRTPGTMSTKRASTMSESAVALPGPVEASA